MTREHLTAQIRRIRAQESRDPVENAVSALAALTGDQLAEAVARFNAVFDKLPHVPVIRLAAKDGGVQV
jgi:hypothetical protein